MKRVYEMEVSREKGNQWNLCGVRICVLWIGRFGGSHAGDTHDTIPFGGGIFLCEGFGAFS